MTIKDLVFTPGHMVHLLRVEDGDLVYMLTNAQNAELLTFPVPAADLRGATFQLTDTPKVFMRWIRRELERRTQAAELIEQARKEWESSQ